MSWQDVLSAVIGRARRPPGGVDPPFAGLGRVPAFLPVRGAAPVFGSLGACRCVGECVCAAHDLLLRAHREEPECEFFREVM